MERTNEADYPRLQALPEAPDAERLRLEKQWIVPLIATCERTFWALSEEGVMDTFYPVANALDTGAPVPDDVRQPALDFGNAWAFMFTKLRPRAVDWLIRAGEASEIDLRLDKAVKEWAKKLNVPLGS